MLETEIHAAFEYAYPLLAVAQTRDKDAFAPFSNPPGTDKLTR